MNRIPHLRLVPGGRHTPVQIAGIEVVSSPAGDPPFPVDTRIVEEDTWRLLSPDPALRPTTEHPIRLMTDLVHDEPAAPGTVLVGRHRWRAVVYDLDRQPICRPEWVAAALGRLLALARERGRRSLALPLLGCRHGPLSWQESLGLLLEALAASGPPPERIWVQVGRGLLGPALEALRGHAEGGLSD
ncbi:MAG: hypothetical protein PVF91_06775 [Chromatiales bacterium]